MNDCRVQRSIAVTQFVVAAAAWVYGTVFLLDGEYIGGPVFLAFAAVTDWLACDRWRAAKP